MRKHFKIAAWFIGQVALIIVCAIVAAAAILGVTIGLIAGWSYLQATLGMLAGSITGAVLTVLGLFLIIAVVSAAIGADDD